ncbi:MAG: DUF3347 domain-containing protein [Bacteroidota bacterium]|nr:DUF3347 domain-containing protein [Bacteroidota bacterium]
MYRVIWIGGLLLLAACGTADKKPQEAYQPLQPLMQSANSPVFNQSFQDILTAYFSLKDQLVAQNDSGINQSARVLKMAVDSLKLSECKADSIVIATAKTYTSSIADETIGLVGETDRKEKKKAFQLISDQVYDLIRTIRYDQAVIYHMYCNTAFPDQGGGWLNYSNRIRNPYEPVQQPDCGVIKDSLDFRPKTAVSDATQ